MNDRVIISSPKTSEETAMQLFKIESILNIFGKTTNIS